METSAFVDRKKAILKKLMAFELNLQSKIVRLTFCGLAALAALLLVKLIVTDFVITTFADRRLPITRKMLEDAVQFFPPSARINQRLAEFEVLGTVADLNSAEKHIKEAIRRSTRDFRSYLLLGDICDAQQKGAEAETAYREALALAPNYSEVHWKLANLLLRNGKQAEAFGYFRTASQLNKQYLPTSLELVWNLSGKNLREVEKLTAGQPLAQLRLVNLLAADRKLPEAMEIFSGIDKSAALKSDESIRFFNELEKSGYPKAARELWQDLAETTSAGAEIQNSKLWDPSFENLESAAKQELVLQKYNWRVSSSDYARVVVDKQYAHTGSQSLRIEFTGRDTTRLGSEVRQRMVLEPGAKYQLSFFAQSENLVSPENPKIAVLSDKGEIIAASEPIAIEQGNWTKITFSFSAPQTASADGVSVELAVIRKPRYAYDEPTKGIIRFDDFILTRL